MAGGDGARWTPGGSGTAVGLYPLFVRDGTNAGLVYAQLVDDATAATIVSARSAEVDTAGLKKSEVAKKVGELLAQRAKDKGIESVVFDRSGYLYHGRVKALAEGAREGGLAF